MSLVVVSDNIKDAEKISKTANIKLVDLSRYRSLSEILEAEIKEGGRRVFYSDVVVKLFDSAGWTKKIFSAEANEIYRELEFKNLPAPTNSKFYLSENISEIPDELIGWLLSKNENIYLMNAKSSRISNIYRLSLITGALDVMAVWTMFSKIEEDLAQISKKRVFNTDETSRKISRSESSTNVIKSWKNSLSRTNMWLSKK